MNRSSSDSIIHILTDDCSSNDKKIFQCKGYENCRVIITRSEHLARHERKHTGEKPYSYIVPGCSRRFSRFDNMMQYTQTHHYTTNNNDDDDDKVPDLIKSKSAATKRKRNTASTAANRKKTTIAATTKKKKKTTTTTNKPMKKQKKLTNNTAAEALENYDHHMAMLMDKLFILSDSSLLTSDEEDFDDEIIDIDDNNLKNKTTAPATTTTTTTFIIGHMILPHLANYLVDHLDEPPENYFFQHYHRLSKQDLLYPIESLSSSLSSWHKSGGNANSGGGEEIYVTIAEFEALQGLCYFACQK